MKAVFLMTAWLLPTLAMAGPTEELVARLAAVSSVSGDFEQVILDQGGLRMQEAAGSMQMARGNRFRWHTQEPFEQLAVSDGQTVWIHDVDLEQVVERPLTPDSASTPALLFGGDPDRVAQAFNVEQRGRHGKQVSYRLRPREDDSLFVELELTFAGDRPHSMRMVDALGQQTVLDFRNVRINETLPDSLFRFVAPDGADVIRQSE